MTSTLIETININADDFTDNFLTCPTCMGPYDEGEHTPKLLSCSHTLCKSCLDRIASSTALPVVQNPATIQANHQLIGHHSNSISRSIAVADAAAAAINSVNSPHMSNTGSRLSSSNSSIVDLYIRCPICRETIVLPRTGGVSNLPPSFIINQLLDLVKNQRRDLVPRCKNHTNEELLFCESCDLAFCSICESHCRVVSNADHIVIPFSIAIKRMTEIFLFKSNQCINSFNLALANVQNEIENLNQTVENVAQLVDDSFTELKQIIEKRREDLIKNLCKIKDSKTKVLKEQMQLILNEKQKVELECKEYHQSNIECRYLGAQIQNINEKLDCLRSLCEPRENSFINYDFKFNNSIQLIENNMKSFGAFRVSNTYPPLCNAKLLDDYDPSSTLSNSLETLNNSGSDKLPLSSSSCDSSSIKTFPANLAIYLQVQTVDYYGRKRTEGGDPVCVVVTDPFGRQQTLETILDNNGINDLNNGLYICKFTPNCIGKYKIEVSIFKRLINQMPIYINVSEFIDSIWTFGGGNNTSASRTSTLKNNISLSLSTIGSGGFSSNKGNSDRDFDMPIGVRCLKNLIYILDSGNNRIKVLNNNGQFIRHIYHNGLNGSSCTSLISNSMSSNLAGINLFTINWKSKLLSKLEINESENHFKDDHEHIDHFESPVGLMETFHPDIFLIQDGKKINLCTNNGLIMFESLENKMKLECNIKNINSLCGNLLKRRIYVSDQSNIYEFDLDWLTDYKLDILMQKFNLTDNILSSNEDNKNKFTYRKFQQNQMPLSSSLTSLASNISLNATISTIATSLSTNTTTNSNNGQNNNGNSSKGTYTALWHDFYTNKLLAAKCDKQKTVIELFNSNTYLYEYSIESGQMEKSLKRVTSLCCTKDGKVVCVDLVNNLVKMFRYI